MLQYPNFATFYDPVPLDKIPSFQIFKNIYKKKRTIETSTNYADHAMSQLLFSH